MYINWIKIKNLRCFREAEIELQYRGKPRKKNQEELQFPNINLLLGNNGSGKSSMLRALALVSLAPVLERSSGLVLNGMVRNVDGISANLEDTELSAELILHEQDLEGFSRKKSSEINVSSRIKRRRSIEELRSETPEEEIPDKIFEDYSPAFLVVGYGVTRRSEESSNYNFKEQSKIRRVRYSRVAGLFENNYGLIPLKSWLPHMKNENKGRYSQVVKLIDLITPEDVEFSGEFIEEEFYFNFGETKIPFGSLSDGYKSFIGWVADLLYHICMGCPSGKKLVDNYSLVLVDEIDLLLHPEWQRTVIQSLAEHLPNVQFVFTTHSPIVASSVEKENIYVMEEDWDGSATIKQYDERIYGLNAEQVLLSSYFGLRTTRPASFVENVLEPLIEKSIKGDHKATLQFMDKISGPADSSITESDSATRNVEKLDRSRFKSLLNNYKKTSLVKE
ncbi:MAG: AAA family ATPase [Pyrinomonadaceae bacterium]